ncbi:MAG: hypothetical protein ACRELT_18870 [Longimicrobiales bacterium]
MTQPSRTTETINRDNAAIRDIMHQVRELTVPDRATLAVGLVGHLAAIMNGSQVAKLMKQLQEEAACVQDVPPSRQTDDERAAGEAAERGNAAASRQTSWSGAAEGRSETRSRAMNAGGVQPRSDAGPDGGVRPDEGGVSSEGRGLKRDDRESTTPAGDVLREQVQERESRPHEGVGQGGRGEFRSRKLL